MKEKISIDKFIEELSRTLEEMGLEKPVYGNKTGSFITIMPKPKQDK